MKSSFPNHFSLEVICCFILLMSSCYLSVFGQCNSCKSVPGFTSDYCYVDTLFQGYCGQFSSDQHYFVLQHGKKLKNIPAFEDFELTNLISIANDKKLKISAGEILFIQRATKAWSLAKRDIGMNYTDSGLGYKIIKPGGGPLPQKGQMVKVQYRGTLSDGTIFDDSWQRGEPIAFPLGTGRVIKGWDEGISLLNIGTRAILKIPPDLGYGSRGAGTTIPPNATLYFDVEVVGVE